MDRTKILVVDDDEDDFINLRDLLAQMPNRKFELTWAPTFAAGKEAILSGSQEVCFVDYRLGPETGLDLLRETLALGCRTPLILLTGYGEEEVDLEAMRVGAADYLVKDQITPALLERSVRYSIHRRQTLDAREALEAQVLMQDRLASAGLLASSLAHEIGTPLGVIRGRAELLMSQIPVGSPERRSVDIIIAQIDRVSKLIRSLLNLARGDQTRSVGKVDLHEIVGEVLEFMGHEFSRSEVEIRDQVPDGIAIPVRAEAEPLHQVLLNLLVNSVHAIETAKKAGRVSGHFIRISVSELPRSWELAVEDSGCGISEKNLLNLFKPFFTTKDIGVGTGLGLATSYRIVESWGGSIRAESREGEGATFRILLPKAKTKATSKATEGA